MSLHIKAKKSFGQHFLKNPEQAAKIAGFPGEVNQDTGVLEIGPGKGIMTYYLRQHYPLFKCVELDKDMVAYLNNIPELNGKIIESDILKLPLDKVFDGKQLVLIGNFPYNISSQIVFHMLKYKSWVPQMIGMFQKEMAERIIAKHGSKVYGVISVLTQAYYEGQKLLDLPPGSFIPPPKVDSAVISLKRLTAPLADVDESAFRKIVKTSFLMRRKMLRNNLKPIIEQKELLSDKFFDQRPEHLSVEDYVRLTKYLKDPENNKLK